MTSKLDLGLDSYRKQLADLLNHSVKQIHPLQALVNILLVRFAHFDLLQSCLISLPLKHALDLIGDLLHVHAGLGVVFHLGLYLVCCSLNGCVDVLGHLVLLLSKNFLYFLYFLLGFSTLCRYLKLKTLDLGIHNIFSRKLPF